MLEAEPVTVAAGGDKIALLQRSASAGMTRPLLLAKGLRFLPETFALSLRCDKSSAQVHAFD